MFGRNRGAQIVVDLDGLGRLIRDLHNGGGLHMAASGPTINIFAQTSGNFLVRLDGYHTSILRKAVREYEFSDVYGPRGSGT